MTTLRYWGTRLILFGTAGILSLLAALWVEHRSETTLPSPTGPLSVGRAIYDWTDDATPDTLAPVPGTKRELLVWIWYPASVGSGTQAPYVPGGMRAAMAPAGLFGLLTRDWSKVHAHSFAEAGVSGQERSYPVVIMRAGASLEVSNYTTLAEDLASHGYVVAGFDAPYRTFAVTFPDGRVMNRLPANNPEQCEDLPLDGLDRCASRLLNAWSSDTAFVLSRLENLNASDPSGRFAGRLDMTRVGVFGHSFGGAMAAQFCHDDARCKAGIDLDGQPFGSVIPEGLHQPFMFVLSDHIHGTDPETRRILANVEAIYKTLPPDGRAMVAIRGANHFLFSDDGALLKSHIVMGTLRMLGIVGIEGRRQLAVTTYCVHRFFDAYLKGTGGAGFGISSPEFPEIEVLK